MGKSMAHWAFSWFGSVFLVKSRMEEQFMARTFGLEYED